MTRTEYHRQWRSENKEKVAEYDRRSKAKPPEAVNSRKRRWEKENEEHFLAHRTAYDRGRYETLKEEVKARVKKDREQHPAKHLLHGARVRAKRLGLPFSITRDDIVIPVNCPVLGVPLVRNLGNFGPGDYSPTLDRIRPALGYVIGNIEVISHRANSIKRDATADEIEAVARWLRAKEGS